MPILLRLICLGLLLTLATACGEDLPGFESTSQTCADQQDNDQDGLVDCADPECRNQPVCTGAVNEPVVGGDAGIDDAGAADAPASSVDSGADRDADPTERSDSDSATPDLGGADGAVADGRTSQPTPDAAPSCATACDQPPNGCYSPQGRCGNDGVCRYAYRDGFGCDDRDPCTDGDACTQGECRGRARVCNAPPADSCLDGALLGHAGVGECVEGKCDYQARELQCEHGCDAAAKACVGDPCSGVRCVTPPSVCYQKAGVCGQGVCGYLFANGADCDDGNACTSADSCASGVCAGQPISCDDPPASSCLDAATQLTYSEQGRCSAGKCGYSPQKVACKHGCDRATGRCKGDPCAGVRCDTPPSGCYAAQGSCELGRCEYAPVDGETCDDGNPCTVGDQCAKGLCRGKPLACLTPPAAVCESLAEVRAYRSPGQCVAGKCEYPDASSKCEFGCKAGACLGDPCADVRCDTPPNHQCYAAQGICTGGKCRYLETDEASCDDNDPCTVKDTCSGADCRGVPLRCATPPRDFCQDERYAIVYSRAGECASGKCEYPSKREECLYGCDKKLGACRPEPVDPCKGVRCVTPPAPSCKDSVTQIVYGKEGKCVEGKCEYPRRFPPCDAPPPNYCHDKLTLMVYPKTSPCRDGRCVYKPDPLKCRLGCSLGRCQFVITKPLPITKPTPTLK